MRFPRYALTGLDRGLRCGGFHYTVGHCEGGVVLMTVQAVVFVWLWGDVNPRINGVT